MSREVRSPCGRVLSASKRGGPPGHMIVLKSDDDQPPSEAAGCPRRQTEDTGLSETVHEPKETSTGGKGRGSLPGTRTVQATTTEPGVLPSSLESLKTISLTKALVSPVHRNHTLQEGEEYVAYTSTPKSQPNGPLTYDSLESGKEIPLDLLSEFLASLMLKDYLKANRLCQQILSHDPEHSVCKDFQGYIETMIELQSTTQASDSTQSSTLQRVSGAIEQDLSDSSTEESGDDEGHGEQSTATEDSTEELTSEEDDDSGEDEDESEIDENEVAHLNLLMGGRPVRKPKPA